MNGYEIQAEIIDIEISNNYHNLIKEVPQRTSQCAAKFRDFQENTIFKFLIFS
jgi:hypothetical protein